MKDRLSVFAVLAYGPVGLATFVYLTFLNGYAYSGLIWLVAVAVNGFMGMIWPIYWILLRWIIPA